MLSPMGLVTDLVSDISKVDYLADNKGAKHLHPLSNLPVFVDDLYVFGYLQRKECVEKKGKLLCISGEGSSAQTIVYRIANAISSTIGQNRGYMQTSIVHTIRLDGTSTIRSTIQRIERDTNEMAKNRWKELYPKECIYGVFVAKVDMSEVPIEGLQEKLPDFQRQLLAHGYGIYSIDYTRDFSGTLDR